ncbi:EF-hand domain-containing protein D2-like [Planoprotostelium fungivorum]|uniref:EF-hand domain-containing protein D2-like n=1 Tax=Planoprotostelium fungivorum TaxID=1890364 RepID=A0A2P6N746_9EUKA|nr:EF-hand domain-containing protein D2-like [Planoprotostelium fungivorum]
MASDELKKLDPRLVEIEFKNDFTQKELEQYREWFTRFDQNKSGELELFELNIMYEDMGEPKTNLQLRALIAEADTTNTGAINYREFLAVLLKDKKGITKGPWKGFSLGVGKVHDEKKVTGKKANFFEQEIAKQKGDPLEEEKRRIAEEEKRKAKAEAERKKKVQEGLAKLKSGINGKAQECPVNTLGDTFYELRRLKKVYQTNNPKNIPMVQAVRHPKWTPRLRSIRSYFRMLYLLQAPALWIMWLEMRLDKDQSQSYQRNTLWVEDAWEHMHPTGQPDHEVLMHLTTGNNTWTGLVRTLLPNANTFTTSPQLAVFILQFSLYLTWPIVFFCMKKMGAAVFVAAATWVALYYTVQSFWEINPTASFLLYPYFSWITTTAFLSLAFWVVNRARGGETKTKREKAAEKNWQPTYDGRFAEDSDDEESEDGSQYDMSRITSKEGYEETDVITENERSFDVLNTKDAVRRTEGRSTQDTEISQ